MANNETLPAGLPVPIDDGACRHLYGKQMPSVALQSTGGGWIDLSRLRGTTVLYIYPISGSDDSVLPDGWDLIPGARGCTPQACSFRNHHAELRALGATVYGISTQTTEYQRGEVSRIHLPFELLSDADLALTQALQLPVFDVKVAGAAVLKRVTLICDDARISRVLYPVFPPDKSADEVLSWLKDKAAGIAAE